MNREIRGGRPGGDRPQRGRPSGAGRSQRGAGTEGSAGRRGPGLSRGPGSAGPGGISRGPRAGSGRSKGFQREEGDRFPRSGERSERPSFSRGGERSERPSFQRDGERTGRPSFARGGERTERPSFSREGSSGRGGARRDTDHSQGDRRGPATGRTGGVRGTGRPRTHEGRGSYTLKDDSAKKLTLRKEKRLSKGELLRELGYSDRKSYREASGRPSGIAPELKGDLIRLNRFISNSGICSRREADKYISAGVVVVNGQIVTELGTKVSPEDEVRFDGRLITPERKVYLLLNKPKDFVTTTDDPHATQTVMDLIRNACEERVYPIGRLDRNTTGLLLFTNDGDLAKRLSHPSHKVNKVYQVTLDKNVSVNDLQKITDGFELEDGLISADAITYVEGMDKNVVGIEIHSGRNRIVRRMFEHLGYRVRALDRVSYAGLTKKNLPRGKWRFLSPPEVSFLKMK
jgi:23S rRNA pseudouridine2605 synthase